MNRPTKDLNVMDLYLRPENSTAADSILTYIAELERDLSLAKSSLEELYSGKSVVLPNTKDHAKHMEIVAQAFLNVS